MTQSCPQAVRELPTIDKTRHRGASYRKGLWTIIPKKEVLYQVRECARCICANYAGRNLTLIPVLHGAINFVGDLLRCFNDDEMNMDEDLDLTLRAIVAESYPIGKTPTPPRLWADWLRPEHVRGRDCLVVDDVLDTGATAKAVHEFLEQLKPNKIEYCWLLRKDKKRPVGPVANYCLFDIPDAWVVGYGLNGRNGEYRHLRHICRVEDGVQC